MQHLGDYDWKSKNNWNNPMQSEHIKIMIFFLFQLENHEKKMYLNVNIAPAASRIITMNY